MSGEEGGCDEEAPLVPGIDGGDAAAEGTLELSASLLGLLSKTGTFEESLGDVLAEICRTTTWGYGEAWLPDEGDDVLRRRRTYVDDDRFAAFEAATGDRTFARGEGLVGRVWATSREEWIDDVVAANPGTFVNREAAAEHGVHAALAIPIPVEGHVVAVLAFFTAEPRETDEKVLHTLGALATHLGTLLVRERLEQRVMRERELLDEILQVSPVGLMVVDRDGRIERVNERLVDLMGVDRETLLTMDYRDASWDLRGEDGEPLPESKRPVRTTFATGRPQLDRRLDLRLPSGERIEAIVNAAPITDADGSVERVVVAIDDRTAEYAHQRELEEKTAQLESFASVLSHDLRNPLSVVKGYLELARETGQLTYLEPAERGTERMEALINDLLLLARRGQAIGEKTTTDVGAVARAAWATVDTAEATLEVSPAVGTVQADESRLQQVFENLFRNAVEHAGSDCHVRVVPLRDAPGFAVEDDGPGIPTDRREGALLLGSHQEGGVRLGLAIAAAVAEAHGWTLTITDAERGETDAEREGTDAETGRTSGTTDDDTVGARFEFRFE